MGVEPLQNNKQRAAESTSLELLSDLSMELCGVSELLNEYGAAEIMR